MVDESSYSIIKNLLGIGSAPKKKKKSSGGGRGNTSNNYNKYSMPIPKEAVPDDLFMAMTSRKPTGLKEQEQRYASALDELKALRDSEAGPMQLDLSSALLAGDLLLGTNRAKDYKAPASTKDKIRAMELSLNKLASGVSESQRKWFKEQWQPTDRGSVGVTSAGSGSGSSGARLTATEQSKLADLKTQIGTTSRLMDDWRKRITPAENIGDTVSEKLWSYWPNSDEAQYRGGLRQKAQLIGRALEGGKLSDVDYTKYIKFLPQPGDSTEQAEKRIADLNAELKATYDQRIKTFGEGDYDVSGFTPIKPPKKKEPKKQKAPAPKQSSKERNAKYRAYREQGMTHEQALKKALGTVYLKKR